MTESSKCQNIKKMKSQEEMKSQKEKWNLKKKQKKKKISELNQCQCQTMSVSDNIRI